MNKIFLRMLIIIISNIYLHAEEVLYSCGSTKSELYDLVKTSSNNGYKKDSLEVKIVLRNDKVYVKAKDTESELIYLKGHNPQFLEKIASGHYALYTIHTKNKILTIQKSYDLFGPIMVNMILQCK